MKRRPSILSLTTLAILMTPAAPVRADEPDAAPAEPGEPSPEVSGAVSEATAPAEPAPPASGFGATIGSAVNGEVLSARLIASGLYYNGRHQVELGVGFHPFFRQEQDVLSVDANYKLFPNGREDTLNTYMLANLSYINASRVTFFPTTYHYLFLHGGYGVELNGLAGSYIDTNVSFGGFTYAKDSENPASSYLDADQFFEDVGFSVSFQANVGYRF